MMVVITLYGMPLCNMKPALFPVISISEVSDLVRPVCIRFPDLLGLSVYGSRARGEAHEDSDWDLMAEFLGGDDRRRVWRLEDALREVLGDNVGVIDARREDDRWRARIRGDLVPIYGEPIAWPGIIPMSREDAVADRLRFQMQYIVYAIHGIRSFHDRCSAPVYAEAVCNTLRNVLRHRPEVYRERFSSILLDPEAMQDRFHGGDENVREEFEDIMPDLEDAAARLLSDTVPVPVLTDRPWAVDDIMSRRTGSTAF